MKYSLRQRVELIATMHTGVAFAGLHTVKLSPDHPAFRACINVSVAVLEYCVQAYIVIRKVLLELLYCVSHSTFNFSK